MGLSRNKVAVSEGAAGSPPFYGESNLLETQQAEIEEETIKTMRRVIEESKDSKSNHLLFDFQGPSSKGKANRTKGKRNPRNKPIGIWGCSSVGRAPALQAGGHGFESHHLHQRRKVSGEQRDKEPKLYGLIAQVVRARA